MPVHNAEIADIFDHVADLLEIEDANPFRVRAYRNAARTIRDLNRSLAEMLAAGADLADLPDIGDDLAGKIAEIVETGHLSAYNLTYEEDTPFFESFQNGDYRDDPDLNAQMFELAHEKLTTRGYHHYETSNYGLEDRKSLHNQAYWEGADYLGLGPSAVSTISGRRWKNVPDTSRYLHQIERVGHAETEVENLTAEQFDLERIALMLRTERGVPKRHLGIVRPKRIEQVISEDLAEFSAENLRLIGRGPLLVDSIGRTGRTA